MAVCPVPHGTMIYCPSCATLHGHNSTHEIGGGTPDRQYLCDACYALHFDAVLHLQMHGIDRASELTMRQLNILNDVGIGSWFPVADARAWIDGQIMARLDAGDENE